MCRSIKPLFNFEPPADADEVRAAALQIVRKVSGSTRPSRANKAAFDLAVGEIADSVQRLLGAMTSRAPARHRATDAPGAKQRPAAGRAAR